MNLRATGQDGLSALPAVDLNTAYALRRRACHVPMGRAAASSSRCDRVNSQIGDHVMHWRHGAING